MKLYMVLLHYPVYNKNKEIVATSIVIHDLHDMSRAAKTYGIKKFYVVQPMEEQKKVVGRILHFWETVGYEYNPNRLEAISILSVKDTLYNVVDEIKEIEGIAPFIVGTSAKRRKNTISFIELANKLKDEIPILVVFGTGWGIPEEFENNFHAFLPPIVGIGDFNHLSVRSASSIILDRLILRYKQLTSSLSEED